MNRSHPLRLFLSVARIPLACIALAAGSGVAVAQGVFLVDSFGDQLYAVDHYTANVAAIGSTANNGLQNPVDLTWRRVTQELWTIDRQGGEIGTIDTETAVFTPVHATGMDGWDAIAWHEVDGCFYMTHNNDNLYRFTPWNGQLTLIGPTGYDRIGTLDVDADHKLYGVAAAGWIVQLDTGSGQAYQVSLTTNSVNALAIEPYSGRWYAIDGSYDTVERIDPATGATTFMGSLSLTGFLTLPRGMAFAARRDGGIVGDHATGDLSYCDFSTGTRHFLRNVVDFAGHAYDAKSSSVWVGTSTYSSSIGWWSAILRLNLSDGTYAPDGGSGFDGIDAMAFDDATGRVYVLRPGGILESGLPWSTGYVPFSVTGPTGLLDLNDLAFDSFGNLFGVRANGEIHAVDKLTGATSFVANAVPGARGLTVEAGTGHFLVQANGQLHCVDRETFAVTPRGLLSAMGDTVLANFAHAPAYVIDGVADQIASLDLESGAAERIAATNSHGLSNPTDLTYRAGSDELWVLDGTGGELGIFEPALGEFTRCFDAGPSGMQAVAWDEQTAAFYLSAPDGTIRKLDAVVGLPVTLGPSGFSDLRGLDVDKDGALHGVDYATGSLVTIDKATGAATAYATTTPQLQALSIDVGGGDFYVSRTTFDDLGLVDPVGGAYSWVGSFGAGLGSVRGLEVLSGYASTVARVLMIGSSCGGMSAASQAPPQFGTDWELYLDAPAGTLYGGVAIGLVNPNLPLDAAGAPGCGLYTDMVDIVWVQMPFGTPSHAIAVPPVGSLAGFELYVQAFGYAPQVNDLAIVTSNGIYGRVGW